MFYRFFLCDAIIVEDILARILVDLNGCFQSGSPPKVSVELLANDFQFEWYGFARIFLLTHGVCGPGTSITELAFSSSTLFPVPNTQSHSDISIRHIQFQFPIRHQSAALQRSRGVSNGASSSRGPRAARRGERTERPGRATALGPRGLRSVSWKAGAKKRSPKPKTRKFYLDIVFFCG